jgi:hypothetical protein
MLFESGYYAASDGQNAMQPFIWDAAESPIFGQPYSVVNELPWPSGFLGH